MYTHEPKWNLLILVSHYHPHGSKIIVLRKERTKSFFFFDIIIITPQKRYLVEICTAGISTPASGADDFKLLLFVRLTDYNPRIHDISCCEVFLTDNKKMYRLIHYNTLAELLG